MVRRFAASTALVLVAVLTTPRAHAQAADAGAAVAEQPAEPSAKQRAEALFEESVIPYREGRFDEAIRLLKQAYELYPEAVLLYNLARAYEGNGELVLAADMYAKYLELEPQAADRGAIERRIARIRELSKKPAADPTPPPAAPPARASAAPTSDGGLTWMPWALLATGGAVIATGGVFAVLANQKKNDARDADNHREASARFDEAERRTTFASVAFITGGVLAVGGVTWLVLARRKAPAEEVTVGVGPFGVGISGSL